MDGWMDGWIEFAYCDVQSYTVAYGYIKQLQKIQDKCDFKYYILGSVFFSSSVLILDLENRDTLTYRKCKEV